MLRNGRYTAWFRTPQGEGVGTLILRDGRVSGRDTVIDYSGWYDQDGDRFTARIKTWRHTDGDASVFGIDEVDIELSGRSTAALTAFCSGHAREAPGIPFEATLVRIAD